MFSLLRKSIFTVLVLLSTCAMSAAQPILERISMATRSDGKGYVVRLHLSAKVTDYSISQPTYSLIQFSLDNSDLHVPLTLQNGPFKEPIEDVAVLPKKAGYGLNIFLSENTFLSATAYQDGATNDILISLLKSDENTLSELTKKVELKEWSGYANETASSVVQMPVKAVLAIDEEPLPIEPTALLQNEVMANTNYDAVKEKVKFDVIVIDAGHGGKDPGALGYRKTREKDIALKVAKKLGAYINEYLPDVKVVYTRDDDRYIGLEKRGKIANEAEGDLFISLHCNAFRKRSVEGVEVFFLGMHRTEAAKEVMLRENSVVQFEMEVDQKVELSADDLAVYELMHSGFIANSQLFATAIDQQFTKRVNRPSRGVKQAGFVVLWHAAMPSVLVELGFISNPDEEKYLSSDYGQTMLASALFRSVRDYKIQIEKNQHLTNINK